MPHSTSLSHECKSTLAVAAIILWNTVYLGRAVDELRSHGETVPDDLLAHAAPLGWEHIAFNGDYVWPAESPANRIQAPTKSARRIPRYPLACSFGKILR